MIYWWFLAFAGIFEVLFSYLILRKDLLKKYFFPLRIIAFIFIVLAVKNINISILYTLFIAMAVLGDFVLSVFLEKNLVTATKVFFFSIILLSILALQYLELNF